MNASDRKRKSGEIGGIRWKKSYKTFAERTAGLQIDKEKFARQMANLVPAEKCYVIVFTPRSGSSWLVDVLSGTRHLGRPGELLNGNFIRNLTEAMNAPDQQSLLEMLKRRRKTDNGVFGVKVTGVHIVTFGEKEFFSGFDRKTVFFTLWRENIVAQAISLYRLRTTGKAHSDLGRKAGRAAIDIPEYDVMRIRHLVKHLVDLENEGLLLLDRNGLEAKSICYEEIVKSDKATIAYFCNALGIDLSSLPAELSLERNLAKISDSWNAEAEEKFRATEAGFIREMEGKRQIKQRPREKQFAAA